MSLAAAVPYVLAYEDQMQSAASSRVPAHAQIGQHQQNRGVSLPLKSQFIHISLRVDSLRLLLYPFAARQMTYLGMSFLPCVLYR